jgi:hypothetical protein
MIEGLRSSETSVPTRATRRNIPENTIPQVSYYLVFHFDTYSMDNTFKQTVVTVPRALSIIEQEANNLKSFCNKCFRGISDRK